MKGTDSRRGLKPWQYRKFEGAKRRGLVPPSQRSAAWDILSLEIRGVSYLQSVWAWGPAEPLITPMVRKTQQPENDCHHGIPRSWSSTPRDYITGRSSTSMDTHGGCASPPIQSSTHLREWRGCRQARGVGIQNTNIAE